MTLGNRRTGGRPAAAVAFALAAALALPGMLTPVPAGAAQSETHSSVAAQANIITAENGVAPDSSTVSAGLDVRLGDGWKTYWKSPGEVGIPPSIDWSGSQNVASVDFLWPAPDRFRAFGIENFGYKHEVVFPLSVTLEDPGQPVRLNASVNMLVCSDVCVPENFDLALDLPQGSGIDTASASRIAQFAKTIPETGPQSGLTVEAAHIDAEATVLTASLRSDTAFTQPDVFPIMGELASFGTPDIRLADDNKQLWVQLPILAASDESQPLSLTMVDGERAVTLDAPLGAKAPPAPYSRTQQGASLAELAWIALIALIGGLILNVMPCVLPVLSIKLSSAIKGQGQSLSRIRGGFLMSALGVLAFMWVLASATLFARSIGLSVGWGLQFQNPLFLTVMVVVLVLFAANLFGVFEINLPSSWQTRMARSDGSPGYGGDFATGAFAAVLATPCSAPFLGTAVAFALSGRPVDIFVIFTALGLGLALPYFAVALKPGLVRKMPKPGRWMLLVKLVLGGLLALTAAWLFWVLAGVAGQRAALTVGLLLALAVGVLLMHRLGGALRWGLVAVLAAAAVATPLAMRPDPVQVAEKTDWVAFDRGDIARRVSGEEVIFVDVTADWCLTCKANKALVIERDPVASALAQDGITPMQADWTRPDPAISRYLEEFGRFGIPFNAVYGPGAPEGIALPELLSAEAVLDALDKAGRKQVAASGG